MKKALLSLCCATLLLAGCNKDDGDSGPADFRIEGTGILGSLGNVDNIRAIFTYGQDSKHQLAKVDISEDGFTMNLPGEVDNIYLRNLENIFSSELTITPALTRGNWTDFYGYEGGYERVDIFPLYSNTAFPYVGYDEFVCMYVDRHATVQGTTISASLYASIEYTYDLSLGKGWNYWEFNVTNLEIIDGVYNVSISAYSSPAGIKPRYWAIQVP